MLKQFIPNDYCLKCDVCCRFGQKNSIYAPKFLPSEVKRLGDRFFQTTILRKNLSPSCGGSYLCQYFSPFANSCNIYANRPLDCQLYPFMVTYDKEYENIILCIDTKCPYVKKMGVPDTINVETRLIASLPHDFIMPYQHDTIKIATIKNLGGFKALALEHRDIFNKYLAEPEYSTRTFVNIYIWSDLFNIMWKIVDNNLCVFYEYKNEFNMLLPAVSGTRLLKPGSRIENIAEDEVEAFKSLGVKVHKNTDEYVYLAKDIAELKGNKFASHRAAKNNFVKNNKFIYRPFETNDIDECLALYHKWIKIKMGTGLKPVPIFRDSVQQQLMEESLSAHKKAMLDYEELGLIGRVVEINNKIKAYTFAFKLNADTYCIIFETTDINIKGLAEFIFSSFAKEISKEAKYINAMDDSGLENLKKTKLSWHPSKILTSYIAER